jgi:nucleoid-associated protein YgaU
MGSGAKIALVALLILMVVAVAKFVQNGSEEGSVTEAGAKKDGPRLGNVATAPQLKKAPQKIMGGNRQFTPVIPSPKVEKGIPPSQPSPPIVTRTETQPPGSTPPVQTTPMTPPAVTTPPAGQPLSPEPGAPGTQIARLPENDKVTTAHVPAKVTMDPKTFLDPNTSGQDLTKKEFEPPKPPETQPTTPVVTMTPAYPLSHKVAEGESWWTIAEKYYGAGNGKYWKTVQDANGGGKFAIAGKTIKVPAPPAQPAPKPVIPPATLVKDTGEAFDYVVQKGDTLWTLSRKFGRKVSDIEAANNLAFRTLYAGAKIRIPKK